MGSRYPKIDITKNDLRKIVYFTLLKFRNDPLHLQGTSAKGDLMGGYIERWFNKIAETIILNNLLKDKKFKVVSDYYIYRNDSKKNAPDTLGIVLDSGKNIPFAKYKDGEWIIQPNMPSVEIKVVRSTQALAGVREPQMTDDYYMFIESELQGDYLSTIFEDEVFDDRYFDELKMPEDYIESDKDNQIIPHSKMKKSDKVGTVKLIGTYSPEELRRITRLCRKDVSPYYFAEAVNVDKVRGAVDSNSDVKVGEDGIVEYTNGDNLYLPFVVQNNSTGRLKVLKKNLSSFYLETDEQLIVNGSKLESGKIKIAFKKFERSSKWDENIVSKFIMENLGRDCTGELIKVFDSLAKNVR